MANHQTVVVVGNGQNVAAASGEEWYLPIELPGNWYILSAALVADEAVALDASHYTTLTLRNDTAALDIATRATNIVGLTKGARTALSLTEGLARVVRQNDVLKLTKADTGDGVAFQGRCAVTLEQRNL